MKVAAGIFREYDIRGIAGNDLTSDTARLIGRGYAAFLREQRTKGAVAVGRDNRPSGDELQRALIAGLTESGLDVVDIGVIPTPVGYWAQHVLDVKGGIVVTGSHNPPEYNGFKLGLGTKSLWGAQIQHIRELIERDDFPGGSGTNEDSVYLVSPETATASALTGKITDR
jgi:phosphomannomutase/phosphoglucomutase